ncbi:MAG: hypothetical protein IIB36_01330 [Gemmatimonadetes bacterium]|nr:hypothetical protein [Gemmatimonadota bacterium]
METRRRQQIERDDWDSTAPEVREDVVQVNRSGRLDLCAPDQTVRWDGARFDRISESPDNGLRYPESGMDSRGEPVAIKVTHTTEPRSWVHG